VGDKTVFVLPAGSQEEQRWIISEIENWLERRRKEHIADIPFPSGKPHFPWP